MIDKLKNDWKIIKEQLKNLVRKNVDVNKHDRLSNITRRHRLNMNSDNTSQCLSDFILFLTVASLKL